MKPRNLIIRILVVLGVGSYISYQILKSVDHTFAFDFIPYSAYLILAVTIFSWTVYKDTKNYKQEKMIFWYLPSILSVLICIGLFSTLYILELRDKSPSQLFCVTKIVDFNGASIDFRADGTYKLTSWCLGADYYRGKYTIKDSVITLDKSQIEKIIVSNRLVIRPEIEIYNQDSIPGLDTIKNRSIYQIDKHGNKIDDAIDFIVREKY